MRNRRDIEKDMYYHSNINEKLIIELLLDIRDAINKVPDSA